MKFKTVAAATAAFLMLAGASFAQQAPQGTAPTAQGTPAFASDAEKAMYEQNMKSMSGFFTDQTMGTLKPDAEVKATFEAMDADSQAGMKSACEKAMSDRGSYGTVTTALCQQVMVM
ncbi:hypothetical protein [Mesorhizobium sp. J428]|uniref:hypothetical protein n=1 Tax=Mesorhizobium sp. J428 TaxID=2898440 RepID=UPI002150FDEA|nr:hypothetical protein [Mesorhizobium sp. J428]MCR5856115.1 hypothetical protein [Mesorhizobium sp. J428]